MLLGLILTQRVAATGALFCSSEAPIPLSLCSQYMADSTEYSFTDTTTSISNAALKQTLCSSVNLATSPATDTVLNGKVLNTNCNLAVTTNAIRLYYASNKSVAATIK